MSDQCKNCTCYGDLKFCLDTPCNLRENCHVEATKQAIKQRLIDAFHEYSVTSGKDPSYSDIYRIIYESFMER